MKKLFFSLLVVLLSHYIALAQTPVVYEAKVYTTKGTITGLLERVYNHSIGLMANDDVLYIDAIDIKKIKVKRYSGSFGSKVLGTALIGSIAALNTAAKTDEDRINNPVNYNDPDKRSTLSDNAGYALAGATVGGLVGAIPNIRKNKKFKVNFDSSIYNALRTDLAQYGRYNQLVPFSLGAN